MPAHVLFYRPNQLNMSIADDCCNVIVNVKSCLLIIFQYQPSLQHS